MAVAYLCRCRRTREVMKDLDSSDNREHVRHTHTHTYILYVHNDKWRHRTPRTHRCASLASISSDSISVPTNSACDTSVGQKCARRGRVPLPSSVARAMRAPISSKYLLKVSPLTNCLARRSLSVLREIDWDVALARMRVSLRPVIFNACARK